MDRAAVRLPRVIVSGGQSGVDRAALDVALLLALPCGGITNLAIRPDAPRRILTTTDPTRLYTLVADKSVVRPESFANTTLLQEAVRSILRKYTDKFYQTQQGRWDSELKSRRTGEE